MYEIWLGLNIVFELALMHALSVAVLAATWMALATVAVLRGGGWVEALPRALLAGAAGTVIAFVALPAITLSSHAEMGYWIDWANLLAISVAAGGVALTLAWPLLVALHGHGIQPSKGTH